MIYTPCALHCSHQEEQNVPMLTEPCSLFSSESYIEHMDFSMLGTGIDYTTHLTVRAHYDKEHAKKCEHTLQCSSQAVFSVELIMLHQHGMSFYAHLIAVGSHSPACSIPPACRNTPASSKVTYQQELQKWTQGNEAESIQQVWWVSTISVLLWLRESWG